MSFHEISAEELSLNPFTLLSKDWMLVTAGDAQSRNTMTASWGGLGELWGKHVSTVYIRPQRYTLEFIERQEYYSLCFFDATHREALNLCGTKSGKDCDKEKEAGLTAVCSDLAPYYEEAQLVFLCRKMYRQDMTADSFLDKAALDRWYPEKDLHRIFVGEIVKTLKKD